MASPFIVASTPVVANLNADQVDGREGTALVESGVSENIALVGGTPGISWAETGFDAFRIEEEGGIAFFLNVTDPVTMGTWNTQNLLLTCEGQIRSSQAAPVNVADLTRRDYVDGRLTRWSACAQFPGTADTAAVKVGWVVPTGVVAFNLRRVKGYYQAGTPTGTTRLRTAVNGIGRGDLDLLIGTAVNTVVMFDAPDFTMSASDRVDFSINLAAGHEDCIVCMEGDQLVGE